MHPPRLNAAAIIPALFTPIRLVAGPVMTPPRLAATVIVTVLFTLFLSPPSARAELDDQIAQLIDAIRQQERQLANLQVEGFELTVMTRPDEQQLWTLQARHTGSAWYDGQLDGRSRISVSSRTARARGSALWMASMEMGYDGEAGRIVQHTRGSPGGEDELRIASISSEEPMRLRDDTLAYATGVNFTLFHFRTLDYSSRPPSERIPLSQRLAAQAAKGALEIGEVNLRELHVVQVTIKGRVETDYWFDPDRDGAFLGYQIRIPDEDQQWRNYRRVEILELTEAGPNLWYPLRATLEQGPAVPGQPMRLLMYRARSATANDPEFDDDVFTVPIPAGYRVTNHITGESYTEGRDGDHTDRRHSLQ